MIIDFPSVRQSTGFTCGPSALQTVLCYYGIDVREDKLKERLGATPKAGCSPEDIVRVAKTYKLKAFQKEELDSDYLVSCISKKVPVIIDLQAWCPRDDVDYSQTKEQGHYVVAIGFTPDKIIFSDSSSFYKVFLTTNDLFRRWHDQGTDTDEDSKTQRLGIIIWGKKPVYSSKIIKPMG